MRILSEVGLTAVIVHLWLILATPTHIVASGTRLPGSGIHDAPKNRDLPGGRTRRIAARPVRAARAVMAEWLTHTVWCFIGGSVRPARAPVGTREGACAPRKQLNRFWRGRSLSICFRAGHASTGSRMDLTLALTPLFVSSPDSFRCFRPCAPFEFGDLMAKCGTNIIEVIIFH